MKNKRSIAVMWLLALVPLILVAVLYSRLPDQVPMHWGIDGTVDRYGSKNELWLMGALAPGLALLFQFLPRLDPKKRSYEKFQRYYDIFAILFTGFLAVVMGLVLVEVFSPGTISMGRVISALVGLLFLFLGNIMGKVKPNFFMGIRTPWTISDPDVWNRTHRLGGALFFLTGLATVISALLLPEPVIFWVLMAGVIASAVVPTVMSYLWYRAKNAA
jgi:uncharacterized membrane protein